MVNTATDVEVWRNPGAGRVVIRRLNRHGELEGEEMVRSGGTVSLSSEERALNQQLAHDPTLDIFANGTLEPVRLIEGSDIALAAASNPNLLSEGDMRTMVAAKGRGGAREAIAEAFAERLAQIGNATTLRRLREMAISEDAPHSRVSAIEARLAEVEGAAYEADPQPSPTDPATPAPPPARPGRGGHVTRPVTTR